MKGIYVSVLKHKTNWYQITLSHSSYFQMSTIKASKLKKRKKKETNKQKMKGGGGDKRFGMRKCTDPTICCSYM
jgi:hypothetical protein